MSASLKFVGTFAAASIAATLAVSGLALAEAESQDPIKIALHDWTGQLINSKILGELLVKAGYNVEYVVADYLAQYAGLETGDLTLSVEAWATTAADAMNASLATGNTENLGEHQMAAKEEWWYPLYMKEKCPGLPDWHALKDPACIEAFSIPETAPKGRYLSGPVTWGGYDDERVEALGLDFEVIHAGTDAAMFAELESAYQRKAPILLWIYSPHWAPAKFEGEWVEFPPYSAECYNDPSVGENPDLAYDCGKPTGPIWKVSWIGMKDKWPGAYKIAKAYQLNSEEMNAMVGAVDLEGQEIDAVAADWIAKNEDRWSKWME